MDITLAERAFLNMRLCDVLYPYQAIKAKPDSNYPLESIIFNMGKRFIIEQLRNRDEVVDEIWPELNDHHCLLGDSSNQCWCSCDATTRLCICVCYNPLYMLIDRIEECNGPINRRAQMRFALADFNA